MHLKPNLRDQQKSGGRNGKMEMEWKWKKSLKPDALKKCA